MVHRGDKDKDKGSRENPTPPVPKVHGVEAAANSTTTPKEP